ncbi:MAG: response regulator transcription factor [Methylovirgula sp.]
MSTEEKDIIFVLDDDEAVRESLKFSLELEGYTVRTCAEGYELLKHPDLAHARCLIVDYKMPQMDGFEVLDRLAAQRVNVPVILITSNASDALRRRAARVGVHQVLEKPLSDGALIENIQSL